MTALHVVPARHRPRRRHPRSPFLRRCDARSHLPARRGDLGRGGRRLAGGCGRRTRRVLQGASTLRRPGGHAIHRGARPRAGRAPGQHGQHGQRGERGQRGQRGGAARPTPARRARSLGRRPRLHPGAAAAAAPRVAAGGRAARRGRHRHLLHRRLHHPLRHLRPGAGAGLRLRRAARVRLGDHRGGGGWPLAAGALALREDHRLLARAGRLLRGPGQHLVGGRQPLRRGVPGPAGPGRLGAPRRPPPVGGGRRAHRPHLFARRRARGGPARLGRLRDGAAARRLDRGAGGGRYPWVAGRRPVRGGLAARAGRPLPGASPTSSSDRYCPSAPRAPRQGSRARGRCFRYDTGRAAIPLAPRLPLGGPRHGRVPAPQAALAAPLRGGRPRLPGGRGLHGPGQLGHRPRRRLGLQLRAALGAARLQPHGGAAAELLRPARHRARPRSGAGLPRRVRPRGQPRPLRTVRAGHHRL